MILGMDLDSAYKIFIISSAILGGLWRIGGRINKLISTVNEHIDSNEKRLDSLEAKVDRNTSKIESVINMNGIGK